MSFTAGASGGEYKHKLSEEEIPNHYHQVRLAWDNQKGNSAAIDGKWQYLIYNDENGYGLYSDHVGGDQSHNNVQPYTSIYRWIRTA